MEKLIRDKIPLILKQKKIKFDSYKLDNKTDLNKFLLKKLDEEVQEFKEDINVEELCDIVEVCYSLLKLNNIEINDDILINSKNQKLKEKGGFEKGFILFNNKSL